VFVFKPTHIFAAHVTIWHLTCSLCIQIIFVAETRDNSSEHFCAFQRFIATDHTKWRPLLYRSPSRQPQQAIAPARYSNLKCVNRLRATRYIQTHTHKHTHTPRYPASDIRQVEIRLLLKPRISISAISYNRHYTLRILCLVLQASINSVCIYFVCYYGSVLLAENENTST